MTEPGSALQCKRAVGLGRRVASAARVAFVQVTAITQETLRGAGPQGHMATGDGFIHFTLTPEPAAALLLLPLLLARPRRRRPLRRPASHLNTQTCPRR